MISPESSFFEESFQRQYQKSANKGQDLEFESILQKIIYQIDEDIPLSEIQRMKRWFDQIHHLDFLEEHLLEKFDELIIHDHKTVQLQTQDLKKTYEIKNLSESDYQLALEVLSHQSHQDWNHLSPYASFKITLAGKMMRATLLHHSSTPDGCSKIFLRHISKICFPLESFLFNKDQLSIFEELRMKKKNLLIAGSTGSGKTSFLRSFISDIEHDEHIVILEDTHEILPTSPTQTHLLADPKMSNKSLAQYCAYALRLRPERIIVGEMRSSEVIPFLLAMNTGHRGLLSTIHANSASEALSRIALLFSIYQSGKNLDYELILKLVCQNIDYVVFLEDHKVKELAKVLGAEQSTPYLEGLF